MKASVYARPEYVIAAAWLAAHAPSLAPSLEDIDSINFALGLRDFDPARHQPHPPGYPVYIALGRVSLGAIARIRPSLDRPAAEALALSIWSAIAGAVAIVAATAFFRIIAAERRAAAVWAGAPLQAADVTSLRIVPPQRQAEWLGLVDYWRGGGRAPVWFFADPQRTDLALIDPRARVNVVRYRWRRPGARSLAVPVPSASTGIA